MRTGRRRDHQSTIRWAGGTDARPCSLGFGKKGAKVKAGEALVVMEAMKMEHTIRAPSNGRVTAFNCAEGDMVEAGKVLLDFEPEAT